MDDHLGVLQQRIQPVAISGNSAGGQRERIGRQVQQQQKENLHCGHDDGSMRRKTDINFVAQAQHESVGGEQQRPEKQRALLPRPQHGKLIRRRQIAIAVMQDVGDGKIVVECGP